MAHADFIHLRLHSAYSLSEGAMRIPDILAHCQNHSMPAVAVTDTNNLFGALEFSMAAKAAGIQPIIGSLLHIHWEEKGQGYQKASARELDQILVLVQNSEGFKNLSKLVSSAFLDNQGADTPQISFDLLRQHHSGLIALTGSPYSRIGKLLSNTQPGAARAAMEAYKELFADRLYAEIMRHGMAEEELSEKPLVDLADELDIPLVATNDVYFPSQDMHEAHDVLLCIADGTYVAESSRRKVTPHHYFKSPAEMRDLFADLPDAIANTCAIAKRCHYFAEQHDPILPAFPDCRAGLSEAQELRKQAEEGLEERLENNLFSMSDTQDTREQKAKAYRERLDFELNVIEQMGFPGYFLIVADFIKWAKKHNIPVGPGRGSGAGSVVAWALTITDLDPLRWGLLFERFLNPERVSMPDFDIDFCQNRRDEVIRYVRDRYGKDRVAQIITFGKLQARAVLRDVGRVLQMPYGQVDRICKLIPNNPANPLTLAEALKEEERFREQYQKDEEVKRLIDIGQQLEGLYRHASTHAAGVVIGDRTLSDLVPLYQDPRAELPATQYNMKYVEQAGLVKFDFLGLKTLTVLQNTVDLIKKRGIDVTLSDLPLDDAKTFSLLSKGDTLGVFQLESTGMRDVLRKLAPDRFEDIIAVVALYRPGPMENIPAYIRRKHGEEKPDFLHPSLEEVLRETHGIMIYQEQVMQIAQILSGYSLGAADLLRRAMGKKIKSEMEAQRESFASGAAEKGVDPKKAEEIFTQVEKFAGYGFNKSHAAAYALLAYQTAFFKANYPVEFLAATMSYEMSNTDKLNILLQHLKKLEIPLLPPDVNFSFPEFSVEALDSGELAIRYALAAVRNVGEAAMENLVQVRREGGLFKSISDFATRAYSCNPNKRLMENLIAAGAFDSLHANRCQLMQSIEAIIGLSNNAMREANSEQDSLFASNQPMGENGLGDVRLADTADWGMMEKLQHEHAALGFYLTSHPLNAYKGIVKRKNVISYTQLLKSYAHGIDRCNLAGIVVSKKEKVSRKGTRFAFVSLSDADSVYEVMVFSGVLEKSRDLLESGVPIVASVAVETNAESGDVRLLATHFESLDILLEKSDLSISILIDNEESLDSIHRLLDTADRGHCTFTFYLALSKANYAEMPLDKSYKLTAEIRQKLEQIPGIMLVEN